jgi:hypothetical protein
VAVWVGYDNGEGKRRTLGGAETGARVAIPIFRSIIESAWASGVPQTALAGPSREAARQLVALPIDPTTGEVVERGSPRAFMEAFRRDPSGQYNETPYRIVSRYYVDDMRERRYGDQAETNFPFGPWSRDDARTTQGWIGSDGRRYREIPDPDALPPPRRRGFFDELFGIVGPQRPQPREPDVVRRNPYYGRSPYN